MVPAMLMELVSAKIDSLVVQNVINAFQHISVSPIVKVCNRLTFNKLFVVTNMCLIS